MSRLPSHKHGIVSVDVKTLNPKVIIDDPLPGDTIQALTNKRLLYLQNLVLQADRIHPPTHPILFKT